MEEEEEEEEEEEKEEEVEEGDHVLVRVRTYWRDRMTEAAERRTMGSRQ